MAQTIQPTTTDVPVSIPHTLAGIDAVTDNKTMTIYKFADRANVWLHSAADLAAAVDLVTRTDGVAVDGAYSFNPDGNKHTTPERAQERRQTDAALKIVRTDA